MFAITKASKVDQCPYRGFDGITTSVKIVLVGYHIITTNGQIGTSRVSWACRGSRNSSSSCSCIYSPCSGCGIDLCLPVPGRVFTNDRDSMFNFSKSCQFYLRTYRSLGGIATSIQIVLVGYHIFTSNGQCGTSRVGKLVWSAGNGGGRWDCVHSPRGGSRMGLSLPVPGCVFANNRNSVFTLTKTCQFDRRTYINLC